MKSSMYQAKDKVILHVFRYLEKGEKRDAQTAIENLEAMAEAYNINARAKTKKPLRQAFEAFIENASGYVNTIPDLIAALR